MGVFEGIANLLFLCMWRGGNGPRRGFFSQSTVRPHNKKTGNLTAVGAARKPIPHKFRFAYFSYQRPSPKSSISKKRYLSLFRTTSDCIQYDFVQGPNPTRYIHPV